MLSCRRFKSALVQGKSVASRVSSAAPIEPLENRVFLSGTTTQTFTIDSALSFATGSGVISIATEVDSHGNPIGPFQNIPLKTQYTGSLTNHASGTITAATSATSIQFVKAAIAGGTTGPATPGNSPANFAGTLAFSSKLPTGDEEGNLYVTIRSLVATLTSGKLTLKNGAFSNAGEIFGVSSGTLGYYAAGTVDGKNMVSGPYNIPITFFTKSAPNLSTLSSTLSTKNGVETLTINATGTIVEKLSPAFIATLKLTGQIVATTSIGKTASIAATAPAAQTAVAGASKSFSLGSFTETGATGPYTVNVNWGDGSANTKFTQTSAGTITAQKHTFDKAATDTVSVTITDAEGHVSNTATFKTTVSPAAASKLVIVTQPTAGTAGAALSPDFTVDVDDAFGNVVITDASSVAIAISTDSPAGGKLSGTASAKAVKGIARFGPLELSKAGTYTLKFTDGKLTAAISKSVVVKA